MTQHFRSFGIPLALLISSACSRSPVAPVPASATTESPAALAISAVSPASGWPFYHTVIVGAGFERGARVTFGGIDAWVGSVGPGGLVTVPPWHEPGTVDVVVTNPDGRSVTLAGGFTYRGATLAVDKSDVRPGETVVVTWGGPPDPSDFAPPDLIVLSAVGDRFHSSLWETFSGVGGPFSATFKAPATPGAYELRYLMLSQYLLATVPLTVR